MRASSSPRGRLAELIKVTYPLYCVGQHLVVDALSIVYTTYKKLEQEANLEFQPAGRDIFPQSAGYFFSGWAGEGAGAGKDKWWCSRLPAKW